MIQTIDQQLHDGRLYHFTKHSITNASHQIYAICAICNNQNHASPLVEQQVDVL